MTKSFKRQAIVAFAGMFLLSFGLTLVMDVRSVHALGPNYFDDDGGSQETCDVYDRNGVHDICGSSEMLLMVGETQYVRQTGGVLRLYFKNRRGQLTIHNHHWCPNNSFGDLVETEDNDQDVRIGENVTRITIPDEPDVIGKRYNAGADQCSGRVEVRFNASQLKDGTGIGLPGLWYADITLKHINAAARFDGVQNAIQLQLSSGPGFRYDPSNDRMIAPLGKLHAQDDHSFNIRGHGITVEQKRGPSNYGLKIRFGTNCEITNPNDPRLDTAIWFYDLDGVGVSGGAQQNGNIRLQLRRINPNTGRDEWLKNGTTNVWENAGPNADNTKTTDTHANDDWRWDFKATVGYKYELRVLNIYSNNTIQVSPPFDSVYGVIDCDYPDVRLEPTNRWNTSEYLEAGETAIFIARLNNSTNKTGFVDDAHGRVWLDGGNRRFDGAGVNGDRVLENNDDYINGRTAIGPGGRRLSSDRQFTADAGYSYLCGQLFNFDASPAPPVETIILPLPSPACLPIGKYPALTARGGDVRAGGVVPNSQVTCRLDGIPNFTDLDDLRINGHYYADAGLGAGNPGNRFKGSYGGLGVLSPGSIQEFGSMGGFYRGPGTSSAYGLFGTRAWGATSHSYNQEGYFLGQNANGATATHCLVDVDALYPAPDAVTELSSNATASIKDTRTYMFTTGGGKTLTLNGANFNKGEKTTIRITQVGNATTNTVVINGSVNYPDVVTTSYGSIAELPQLTIVADKRINVRFADLATVYNGLIATAGNMFTCEGHDGSSQISTAACRDKALVINGMTIVGGKLYPFRTDGFNTRGATGTFAETFTLTPELLLSDYARAQQQSKLRVDLQTGLPPRF